MINLIVAGGGEGTYKNLWPITQSKNPRLDMRIAAIIDILPKEKLHPKAQEIIAQEKVVVLRPDEARSGLFHLPDNAAGVIMTPNDSHLEYAEFFASLRIPFYAEKPVTSNCNDLERFLIVSERNPSLVYAAEYCTDGKALAFLDATGAIDEYDPRHAYINASSDMNALYRQLGRPLSFWGKMLEGEGTAGTADHRAWLLEGTHGGMIRDLLSHLFGPLYDAKLTSSDVINLQVQLGRYEHGQSLGTWRPLKAASEGETYAKIQGKFLTPYGMPDFEFEVGKYWPKHDRSLVIRFERGWIKMSYEKPFEVVIEIESSRATSKVIADFYPTLAFLDFKRFITGKTHGHIGRAAAIVRFNEQARKSGLEQANL